MKLQLIRSATLKMTYSGHCFITDPYFAEKFSRPSYCGKSKNPLVNLPMHSSEIMAGVEMVLISHLHSDHFDSVAEAVIPKDMLLLCQPEDEADFRTKGFRNVVPIEKSYNWNGIRINRIPGEHGAGEVLEEMGPSSGFLFEADAEPSIYWCGDTILCDAVKKVISEIEPEVIVTHSCGAEWGDHVKIVMDEIQTVTLCKLAPSSIIVTTHMDSVDHATVTRDYLRKYAEKNGISGTQLLIPRDGEIISLGTTK